MAEGRVTDGRGNINIEKFKEWIDSQKVNGIKTAYIGIDFFDFFKLGVFLLTYFSGIFFNEGIEFQILLLPKVK